MIPCRDCGRHVREETVCPFCNGSTRGHGLLRTVAAATTLAILTACYGVPPDDTSGPVPVDADGDSFAEDVDCNDADAAVNPDAPELCDDQIDNDCDGGVDAEDTEGCAAP